MQDQNRKRMVVKSEEERLVYGEVYAPLQVDTDDEAMTADEVKKMAHKFLMKGLSDKIDVMHDFEESGCLVVESFVARKNDPDGFIEGSWVLGVKILPDELWEAVKKGEINGFSFAGKVAKSVPSTVVLTVTRKMVGVSEKSEDGGLLPPHDHEIQIDFDEEGHITYGVAKEFLGHEHPITKTTATDMEMEHAHRLVLIQNDGEE